jgi:hypothetical protein
MSELSQLSEADPRRAIAKLESAACSLVRSAYGDELVLGFGKTRPSLPPLQDEEAEWMLYSRATPWILESSMGALLNSYRMRRLTKKNLTLIEETILHEEISGAHIRNRALGLTISFTNGADFLFLPPAPSVQGFNPEYDAWQLVTPDTRIITAGADEELKFIPATEPLPPLTDPIEFVQIRAPEAADFAAAKISTSERSHRQGLERLLTLLITESDYEVFVPSKASALDAMVVSPGGSVVGIEFQTKRQAESRPRPRLHRFSVLTVILTSEESRLEMASRERASVFWSGQSLKPIETALRRLAARNR